MRTTFKFTGQTRVLDEIFRAIDTDCSGMIGFDELYEWLYGHRHSLDSRRNVEIDMRLQLPREANGTSPGMGLDAVAWDAEVFRVLVQQMLMRCRIDPPYLLAEWTQLGRMAVQEAYIGHSHAVRHAKEQALAGLRHGVNRSEFVAASRQTLFDSCEAMDTLWSEELAAVVGTAFDRCAQSVGGTNFLGRVGKEHLERWLAPLPRLATHSVMLSQASADLATANAALNAIAAPAANSQSGTPAALDALASGLASFASAALTAAATASPTSSTGTDPAGAALPSQLVSYTVPLRTIVQLRRQQARRRRAAGMISSTTRPGNFEKLAVRAKEAIAEAAAIAEARKDAEKKAVEAERHRWQRGQRLRWEAPRIHDQPLTFAKSSLRGSSTDDHLSIDPAKLTRPGVRRRERARRLPPIPIAARMGESQSAPELMRLPSLAKQPTGGNQRLALPYLYGRTFCRGPLAVR